MTDLNEWRLEYPGTVFDFGTLLSDYPFAAQYTITESDSDKQDLPHPTSDGLVMGVDSLRGMNITFNLTTLPDFQGGDEPWNEALDLFSAFKSKWRADTVRRTPGLYATLTNLNRDKLVYGRPRKMAQTNDRLRKGQLAYVAEFETNGPDWFSTVLKTVNITPVPPGAGGGITAPISSPIGTTPGTEEVSAVIRNDGDVPAWPIIHFTGPGRAYSLELLLGTAVLWKIQVPDALKFDQNLGIDTRPWARGALINFKDPANGRLRGDLLEKCTIPPGVDLTYRFKVTDPTGTADATISWRDQHAAM